MLSLARHSLRSSALRRALATLDKPHMAAASPAASTLLFSLAASALVAAAIVYAPDHEFDDLDCQSYCQQTCVDGVCACQETAKHA